jgi:alkylation response protein AidB-like acyl-CoA dehydrogenase
VASPLPAVVDGFADALLRGEIRRLAPAPPGPPASRALDRLVPGLESFLKTVDGDAVDRADRVPPRVVAGLRRRGVFGLRVPREHGGRGLSRADFHRVVAAVAARSAGLAMWVTTQALCAELLLRGGTEAQRAELLPRLAAGELAAFAMTEAESGGEPARLAAAARPVPGGYRLSGRKLWATNAPVARWIFAFARAPGGIAAFAVDARAPGCALERRCRFLGLRGMENGAVRLRGALVPAARRLGAEGEGLRLGLGAMSAGRLSVAARARGIAGECLRLSRAWARERRRGGRPLGENAAVAERLKRLETLVARLDAVSARTASWSDAGRELRVESALAKLFAAAAAWEAADLALQLRGARGYETADSQRARGERPEPAERLLRDARGLRLIEGPDDALREAVARRGLELARMPRAPRRSRRGPLAARAAALAADFRALARRGGETPARAYALSDEAAQIFGAVCAGES